MTANRIIDQHGIQVIRMQQIMTGSMVVCATIWMVHFWPTSPWLSIVGGLAWLLGFSGLIAIEFAALVSINRMDPAPRASRKELLRAWFAESCQIVQVFCWRQPFRANAVPDQLNEKKLHGQRGVVFIHGLICNRGFWTPWLELLQKKGSRFSPHAFTAISMEPVFGSIEAYVEQIERAVVDVTRASGLPPILVCHSMGGLAARAWISRQSGACRVHHVVTIGTPHHGTLLARFAQGASGRQMRQGSEWLRQLCVPPSKGGDSETIEKASANAPKQFTCWYSNCDNIVFPTSTATLPGADNRFVRGAGHVQLAFLPVVMEATLNMIMQDPKSDATG